MIESREMSSLAQTLVTWSEFLRLPDRPENGVRYELHDGEVVEVPPAQPIHVWLQTRLSRLIEGLAGIPGVAPTEFPYRPFPNLQFWVADVAYVTPAEWAAMARNEYQVFAPALIIEVLSPSNTPAKVSRQRITAMSAGTQAFWVLDPVKRTVLVTDANGTRLYEVGDVIPLHLLDGAVLAVADIFAI